jgi:glycosyltransferase involved in cell wall biosynthesis
MKSNIKVAVITDSPKLHTGFAAVAKEICFGFHLRGMDVHVYGLHDHKEDFGEELPYVFYPVPHLDALGHNTYSYFLRRVKPDIIWMLTDPGNAAFYLHGMINQEKSIQKRDGRDYYPPVVLYTPIEGKPCARSHGEAFDMLEQLNGTLVTYCETARQTVLEQFPHLKDVRVVNHGLDHAEFQRYSDGDRKMLRRMVGLEDKFVIGSVGVNKRTKGHPALIYTAKILKDKNKHEDILFYCHCNPQNDTMGGYKLRDLAKYYGVEDMFLWKPEIKRGSYWLGVKRDADTLKQVRKIKNNVPDTPEGRGLIFATYDFISIMNCCDLYLDTSQIEGWGLPLGEAMACGIPAISVHDNSVRDEVYQDGPYFIDPVPESLWDTWQTGALLVKVDPYDVADAILKMKDNPDLMVKYSKKGIKCASQYKWADAMESMSQILIDTYERDQNDIERAVDEGL